MIPFVRTFCLPILLVVVIAACSSSGNNQQPTETTEDAESIEATMRKDTTAGLYNHSILFTRIKNRVIVYVNDEEIYTSISMKDNKALPIRVGLDRHVTQGKNTVTVELYNDPTTSGRDASAEVYYELFRERDPVDFVHEVTKTADIGLVLERSHEISIN